MLTCITAAQTTKVSESINHRGGKSNNTAGAAAAAVAERILVAPSQFRFIPSIRFVPKKYSMRPITNLRSTSMKPKHKEGMVDANVPPTGSSENAPFLVSNSSLYSCLHVLRDVSTRNPSLCGFGTLGADDVYSKLRQYKLNCCATLDEMKAAEESNWRNIAALDPSSCAKINSDESDWSEDGHDCNVPEKVSQLVRNRSALRYLPTQSQQSCTSMQQQSGKSPYRDLSQLKFFVAAVDLDKCYDTVDTHQLYLAVKEILMRYGGRPGAAPGGDKDAATAIEPAGDNDEGRCCSSEEEDDDEHTNLVHKYSVSHYIPSLEKPVTKTIRTVTRGNDLIPLSGEGISALIILHSSIT